MADQSAKIIGKRLRHAREALDLSQREMADIVGVSEGNWSDFERGKRRISLNVAIRLRRATNLTLDWIYEGISEGISLRMHSMLQDRDKKATG